MRPRARDWLIFLAIACAFWLALAAINCPGPPRPTELVPGP